jgi:hypothetical protein
MSSRPTGALIVRDHNGRDTFQERLLRLPEKLRPGCERLEKELAKAETTIVGKYFAIGKAVNEEIDRLKNEDQPIYGKNIVGQWAKAVEILPRTLYNTKNVVKNYTRERFDELIKQGVSWSHLCQLISAPTDEDRQRLEEHVAAEHLSVADLKAEISRLLSNLGGEKKRHAAPRTSVAKALDRLNRAAESLNVLLNDGLFGEKFDIKVAIMENPNDWWTPEIRSQVDAAATLLKNLAQTAQSRASDLTAISHRGQQILQKRGESAATKKEGGGRGDERATPPQLALPNPAGHPEASGGKSAKKKLKNGKTKRSDTHSAAA